jgi:beta-galactosidase
MTSFGVALFLLSTLALAATAQGAGPRQRIRFDSDWKFRRNDDDKLSKSGFKWTWRPAPDVKNLDIEDLPANLKEGEWKATRPGRFQMTAPHTFAWFKADLGSDPKDKGKLLKFGGVDDNAVVFLNGKKLMVHRGWNEPFERRHCRASTIRSGELCICRTTT